MAANDRIDVLARFLAMALRDRPREFGIKLDRRGEVSLMDLMGAILDEPDFSWVTMKDVEEAVNTAKPRLFEIRGTSIRLLGTRPGGGSQGETSRTGSSKRKRRRRRSKSGKAQGGKPAQTAQPAARSGAPHGGDAKPGDVKPGSSSRRRRRRRRPASAEKKA